MQVSEFLEMAPSLNNSVSYSISRFSSLASIMITSFLDVRMTGDGAESV